VVPGHLSAEHAGGIGNWQPLAAALRRSSSRVVADLGRIHSESPSLPIAAGADVVVVVCRPVATDASRPSLHVGPVVHLSDRIERLAPALARLREAPPLIVPVVIASAKHAPALAEEISSLLMTGSTASMVAGVGYIAWDPTGVIKLYEARVREKDARSALLTSANRLNGQLDHLATSSSPSAPRSHREYAAHGHQAPPGMGGTA
jgi:hypothetical protein